MQSLIFRTAIIYFCVLAAMRLMGKRQLAEMQPSELVSTFLISNLASISIESTDLPLLYSLIPLFLITAIEIADSLLRMRFPAYARLTAGRPKILIQNGVIDQKTLSSLRLSTSDLLEALRGSDIFDLREVSYAVMETNGTLHAAKYAEKSPATKEDLHLTQQPQKTIVPFLVDGQLMEDNLRYCQKTLAWMEKQLRRKHLQADQLLAVLGDESGVVLWIKKEGCTKQP